jgi:predicted nucleic acid-binding protein
MIAQSIEMLPVTAAHFKVAARIADEVRLGLRAGDALHLAIASEQDATLATLDRRLARAGKTLGVQTTLI